VDDRQVGRAFRSLRIRHGLRQIDVARRAGVSDDVVSLVERGQLERLSFSTIRRLWSSLGVAAEVDPRISLVDRSQLLDAGHASLVERAVRLYKAAGWEVVVEYTFNNFGERGSVDLLSWRPIERALAVNEVKTRLPDVQDVHAGVDRKARIVPAVVGRERGWQTTRVSRILIVADTRANRRVVADHAATFDSSLPRRGREVRAWLSAPLDAISGLWFLAYPNEARRYASRSRVRPRNHG
jgi:transcriptional regulator with XRE-family HTH domain